VNNKIKTMKSIGFYTATAIVIANMIGTGVFTSLGFQAMEIQSGFALLTLWLIGGALALFGALSYAELAAAMPRSGGEYHYLSRIYHPIIGHTAGWISVTVGFSAPVALAAMAFGRYASTIYPVSPMLIASTIIIIVTGFHAYSVKLGERFQVLTTILKLVTIISFCIAGILVNNIGDYSFAPAQDAFKDIVSPAFAVSLIYVTYAFSGWNAATYVAEEITDPRKVLPKALFHGTWVVTALYLLLNFVFLRTISAEQLPGTLEVGALSANHVFGDTGGSIMSTMICLLLISTISAMTLAGPRVIHTIGEDVKSLHFFTALTTRGAPLRAILLQQALALLFVLTDSFEGVLAYAGISLNLFASLTVLGVVILRIRSPGMPRPYRAWGYPLAPLFFVLINILIIVFVIVERPIAGWLSLFTICSILAASYYIQKHNN
jgi:APA family basic amino acid/polyamine antiporter